MTAIKSHLSGAELEHRYKTASEPIAKSHFHALWLLTRGYSIDQVAGLLSFSTRWVRILIKRYNEGATEALARIKLLYDIEAESRGLPPQVRRAMRQEKARPIVEALKPWVEASLAKVPKGGKLGEALGYGLNQWDGLVRYLDDGRIEIDFQHGRALDPPPRAYKEKRALRRARPRCRRLGDDRVADRDVQVELRRSAGVDDRRAHQARQPLAGLAHRGADALGLREKAGLSRCRREAAAPLTL